MDHPFGGWRASACGPMLMQMLELGLVALSVLCFAALYAYTGACDRV